MKAMVTDTETIHQQILGNMNNVGSYCRLNVERGLGDRIVPLDACKGSGGIQTLTTIREKTEKYLESESAKSSIRTFAKKLVDIRMARSNGPDGDRWERFCHGLKYKCAMPDCLDAGQRFEQRLALEVHLRESHGLSSGQLASQVLLGKCYSVEERE